METTNTTLLTPYRPPPPVSPLSSIFPCKITFSLFFSMSSNTSAMALFIACINGKLSWSSFVERSAQSPWKSSVSKDQTIAPASSFSMANFIFSWMERSLSNVMSFSPLTAKGVWVSSSQYCCQMLEFFSSTQILKKNRFCYWYTMGLFCFCKQVNIEKYVQVIAGRPTSSHDPM